MKIFVVFALLLFATTITAQDYEWHCPGYHSAQACMAVAPEDISDLDYCASYLSPFWCSECYLASDSVFETHTNYYQQSCSFNEDKYPGIDMLEQHSDDTDGGELLKLMTWKNAIIAAMGDFEITNISCVSAGTIIIENCAQGYYYDSTTYKCASCSDTTNCLVCSGGLPTECTKCKEKYVLLDGACSACDANALGCTEAGKATVCKVGYFLDTTTSTCTQCTDVNSLCSSAENLTSCQTSYWLKVNEDDGTKSCEPCDVSNNNVLICKGDPTEKANIMECIEPDDDNYYYNVPGYGCLPHDKDEHCETIAYGATGNTCASCIKGFTLEEGKCYEDCGDARYKNLNTSNYGSCYWCFNSQTLCTKCSHQKIGDATTYSVVCSDWDTSNCDYGVIVEYSDEDEATFTSSKITEKRCQSSTPSGNPSAVDGCASYKVSQYPSYECESCFSTYAEVTDKTGTEDVFSCAEINDDVVGDTYYCKAYEITNEGTVCTKCFESVGTGASTIYIATYTEDNTKKCKPVYKDYIVDATNCDVIGKYENEYQCEMCSGTKVPQYPYTGSSTTFTSRDYTLPVTCVSTSTYCSSIDINEDEATRCSPSATCTGGKTLKWLYTSDNDGSNGFTGDYTVSCVTIASGDAGYDCAFIKVDTIDGVYCQVTNETSVSAQCLTSTLYTQGAASAFGSCGDVSTDANTAAAYDQYYTLVDNSAANVAEGECTSGTKVYIHGGTSAEDLQDAVSDYACDQSIATGDYANCSEVDVSGDYLNDGSRRRMLAANTTLWAATLVECKTCDTGFYKTNVYADTTAYDNGTSTSFKCQSNSGTNCIVQAAVGSDAAVCDVNETVANQGCSGSKVLKVTVDDFSGYTVSGYACVSASTLSGVYAYCSKVYYDGTDYECVDSVPDCGSKALKIKTEAASGFSLTNEVYTCEDIDDTHTDDARYQCMRWIENSNEDGVEYKCDGHLLDAPCASGYAYLKIYGATQWASLEADTGKCVDKAALPTSAEHRCTVYAIDSEDVITCSECLDPHVLSSTVCLENTVTNCEKGLSRTTCKTCSTTTWPSSEKTSCLSCPHANCDTLSLDSDVCVCTVCDEGFYIKDGACTDATLDHCHELSDTMTTTPDCLMCDVGYYWDSTTYTCTACAEGKCPETGCDKVLNPSSGSSSSATTDASILAFILSGLVALITLIL